MNTYITDMDKAPAVREVRARYFGDTVPPARSCRSSTSPGPEFLLEIEVIAGRRPPLAA